MQNFDAKFLEAKNLLQGAQKIAIISHKSPDGDTIGANLALRLALKYQLNKEIVSACVDAPPHNFDFLPEIETYGVDFDLSRMDLIIAVDCGAQYMTGFHKTKPTIFSGSPPVINIDHHVSNDLFAKINIIDPDAASTTQILFRFFQYCGWRIDRKIATCLLNGLYYDTGSFMHSNTTPEALGVASELVWKGADFKSIAKKQFHTMPVRQLRLYGRILERARVNAKNIVSSAIPSEEFARFSAEPDDATGAIDLLNSISGGDFSCLIYEERNLMIKGSLRSRVDNIDLSRVAGLFGGGGHEKAAGFHLPGRLLKTNGNIKIGNA